MQPLQAVLLLCTLQCCIEDFPGGSDGKASAYNAETWVQSLGWEDLLEKEMATHSSILAWKIPANSYLQLILELINL